MKKNFKLLLLTLIMGGGLFASEAMALEQKDGVYQIGTANDLIAFASKVNNDGETTAKAVLTADIDMTGKSWTPIGNETNTFNGLFDGQYHVIDNIDLTSAYSISDEQGIFGRVAGSNTTIKNLISGPNNVIKGKDRVGGIIGAVAGSGWLYMENCGNEAYVEASGSNAGGIMGVVFNGGPATELKNCYNTGNVKGGNDSAIITGWSGGHGSVKYLGFWNTGKVLGGLNGGYLWRNSTGITTENISTTKPDENKDYQGATEISTSNVTSGAFAYSLNNNQDEGLWRQNFGDNTDGHPTLIQSHGLVFANNHDYKTGTSITYSNIQGAHSWNDWGFCSVQACNEFNTTWMTPVDGCYKIGTKEQLNWFANYVNNISKTINGKLINNIDYSTETTGVENMIGKEGRAYGGTFDGQGHTVTVGFDVSADDCGLFRRVNGGTIKNLKVDGAITTTGKFAGGIVSGIWQRATIENCVANVTINDDNSGDRTHGGIVARVSDKSSDAGSITIRNCAFTGTINAQNAEGSGGILGWPDEATTQVKIENCLMAGTLNLKTNSNNDIIVRNTATVTNCYFIGQQYMNNGKYATEVDNTQAENGKLCFLLNGKQSDNPKWFQAIGTDEIPLPSPFASSKVYASGSFACDGITPAEENSVTYSNTTSTWTIAEHNYSDGICTICHDLEAKNGVYQIGCADALIRFSDIVNKVSGNSNAILTKEIDMSGKGWTPIGQNEHDYYGHFDGQNFSIKNLTLKAEDENQALFGQAVNPAVIENVVIEASCTIQGSQNVASILARVWGDGVVVRNCTNNANVTSSNGNAGGIVAHSNKSLTIENCLNKGAISGTDKYVGGIIGNMDGGTLTVRNSGNEGNVSTKNWNAGGILGCKTSGNIVNIYNSYNIGTINSTQAGGLSGWVGANANIFNCYNMGNVTGDESDGFIRSDGSNNSLFVGNCFVKSTNREEEGITKYVEGTEFSDGTVFASLFDYTNTDPAVNGNVWRMEFSGTPHPVLYDAAIVYKEDFPNRPVAKENADVTLYRTVKKGGWNTVCMPFAMNSTLINDYFGGGTLVAELDADKDDSDNILHFKTVTSIEAGKAYLVYPGISEDFFQKTLNDISITAATPNAGTKKAGYTFKGVYEPTSLNADVDRIVANGNTIVKTSGGNLKGFRAYFEGESTSNSRPMYFVVEDETTGIISIGNMSDLQSDGYYDLLGRKMVKPANKGLYIQNGNKVIK